ARVGGRVPSPPAPPAGCAATGLAAKCGGPRARLRPLPPAGPATETPDVALTPSGAAPSVPGAGAWRSQVAHSLGVRVVGRSNRLAPTLPPRVRRRAAPPHAGSLAGQQPWGAPSRAAW